MKNMLVMTVVAVALGQACGTAQQVYWVESTFGSPRLRRSSTDGTARISVALPAGSLPQGVAFDPSGSDVYWTSRKFTGAHIYRAPGGLSRVDTVTGGGSAYGGIALDPAGRTVYWTSTDLQVGSMICRAAFNGATVETLRVFPAGGRENPRGIALDIPGRKMYWADFGLGRIRCANLDGTGQQDLLNGLLGPVGIAIDSVGGKLYWSEANGGFIRRSHLNGDSIETLVSGIPGVQFLALESRNTMMYWAEIGAGGAGRIRKATMDGNNPVTIVGSLAADSVLWPRGIAIAETTRATGVIEPATPLAFVLEQNYPNPFNPTTVIRYQLPVASRVTLAIYDLLGRRVAVLVDDRKEAGVHDVSFDASGLPSGVYFSRLQAGSFVAARKLLLVK